MKYQLPCGRPGIGICQCLSFSHLKNPLNGCAQCTGSCTNFGGRLTGWYPHIVNLVNFTIFFIFITTQNNTKTGTQYLQKHFYSVYCIHMNKVTNGNDKWQGHTDCHLAILSGEQVFLADFVLILKVLIEFICISGVIVLTNGTHQTHLIVHLK